MNAPGKLETASATKRFQAKRDAILAAAADAINEQSAKGMTFARSEEHTSELQSH